MKKKTAFCILLIILLASCSVLYKYNDENEFLVSPIDGGKSVEITDYVGTKHVVIIPPLIKGMPVTRIGDRSFMQKEVVGVLIPETVTAIGSNAFSYNPLSSIIIPTDVKEIGESAFAYCELYSSITIPSGVRSIGKYAFAYCRNLKSITIPASVTALNELAFNGWNNLQTINIIGFDCQTGADNAWQTSWRNGCNAIIMYWGINESY